MHETAAPTGSVTEAAARAPYPIRVTCDFSKTTPLIIVDPEEAKPSPSQRIKFICENATLVIVAQHHSRGKKESDHSPFANNILTVKVPLNSQQDSHVTVKGDDALPPGGPDPDIKNPGYKYTIVAISVNGKVGVCDPTVIIR